MARAGRLGALLPAGGTGPLVERPAEGGRISAPEAAPAWRVLLSLQGLNAKENSEGFFNSELYNFVVPY